MRAAGGVVQRGHGRGGWRGRGGSRGRLRGARSVLIVHRPRYDDWSFPKGKRDGEESDEETALREVEEETGIPCTLGPYLGETRYLDSKGREKEVRYWIMDPEPGAAERPFVPNPEVDEVRWLSPRDAARLLSYAHDRALLARLRHARA